MGRPLRILCLVLASLGLSAAVGAGAWAYRHKANVTAWELRFRDADILGRTPEALIARYGRPDFRQVDKDGTVMFMTYNGPYWNYAHIEFTDGTATTVSFSYK